jgi:hypothetical protein
MLDMNNVSVLPRTDRLPLFAEHANIRNPTSKPNTFSWKRSSRDIRIRKQCAVKAALEDASTRKSEAQTRINMYKGYRSISMDTADVRFRQRTRRQTKNRRTNNSRSKSRRAKVSRSCHTRSKVNHPGLFSYCYCKCKYIPMTSYIASNSSPTMER